MGPDKRAALQMEEVSHKIEESERTAERNAQVDSVLRILEESIRKLKIALVLPRIFENPITLRQYLGGTDYERVLQMVEAYLQQKKYRKDKSPHLNYRIVHLIDTFFESFKMVEILPDWLSDMSREDKSLLECFELLYSITQQRLQKTAVSELAKEKKIHQTYHENELMKKNIREFQNKLRNQRINLRWKLAAKDGIIQKYEEDLAYKKWDNNVRIKQEINKSSRHIRNIHQASTAKQKELEEELEKTKASYEKILKQNIAQEKEIREEKNKLLLQLQALLQKYDQNIGEKIKENLHLQEEYDEQKKLFDEFMIEYTREEQEYEEIVLQKEEEDKRKFEKKLMLFMMNRAARVIQRHWRRFRREKRKKGKKGGKGGKGRRK